MHMHAAARFLVNRFWHERGGMPFLRSRIFHNIFGNHGLIRHVNHFSKLHLDFQLSGAANLMMMVFHPDPPILHKHTHFAAQVIGNILGSRNMISAFMLHLISEAAFRRTGIPFRLSRIRFIKRTVWRHLVIYGIKKIKFKFRPYQHLIRRPCGFHVIRRPQRNISGILVKRPVFLFPDHTDIPCHGKRRDFHKGIHHRTVRIRNKNHITFFNRRIPVIGAVKTDSIFKNTFSEPFHRYGDMPETPIQIHHFEIDHTDVVFPAKLQDFFTFAHKDYPRFLRFVPLYSYTEL